MKRNESVPSSIQKEVELLRARVLELEQERAEMEAALSEGLRLATLTRQVSDALIQESTLQESLQHCAQALVTHLGAAFAQVWTLNAQTQILELQASAGMYIDLDGAHSHLRVGDSKIGRIAALKQSYHTNQVLEDLQISDQHWAAREGVVSFAGYPLLIEGEMVGVTALFARTPLSPAVLDAMTAVSNDMASSIKRRHIEEERIYALEIAQQAKEERQRLLMLTEQARQEAEAALQVRNDFLSSVSHDLKTPIAVMRGNVQLLQLRIKREGMLDPIWSAGRLAAIDAATRRMTAMVEELLDMATLQAGQSLDLDMRPVHLISLIQQISTEQQETTRRHQIEVIVPTEDLLILGDRIRLSRVLENLLTNAIKYSSAGGRILVEVTQEEVQGRQWIVVSIQDQGIGIPIADQTRIFDLFYRASNVPGRVHGTGVGLASTAQIVNQHGGIIAVKSEEKQGSTFTLRLPFLNDET